MASLTTTYLVSMILGSILAFASVYGADMVYPIQTGGSTEIPAPAPAPVTSSPPKEEVPPPENTVQTQPEVPSVTS